MGGQLKGRRRGVSCSLVLGISVCLLSSIALCIFARVLYRLWTPMPILQEPRHVINTYESLANEKVSLTNSSPNKKQESETLPDPPPSSASSLATQVPQEQEKPASVLVVGGTDGSGTRRVVQILTDLGVTMVSEDPETYDIHADSVGGWPQVVRPVVAQARSLNYDPDTFPGALHDRIDGMVRKLVDKARSDSVKPTSHKLAVGGALPKKKNSICSQIEFGFKAPVAMTLAPWFAHVVPHFRFIHVLRDGRDIAFSANQGPVDKFYDTMFGPDSSRGPQAKAIRLWSSWNADVHKWATDRLAILASRSDASFDYLVVKTEDIVDPSVVVRFKTIQSIAKWVGSSLTQEDMCCLAVLDSEFMGSHDRSTRKNSGTGNLEILSKRYGKWRTHLVNNQRLSMQLHSEGKEGLQLFGYLEEGEPLPDDSNKCGMTVEECQKQIPPKPVPEVSFQSPEGCKVFNNVDYNGGGVDLIFHTAHNVNICCKLCVEDANCRHFTFVPVTHSGPGSCYLKSGTGKIVLLEDQNDLIPTMQSGDRIFR